MTAREMFNELTFISDSWDGEYISFHKDMLEGYLKKLETKLENTSPFSECTATIDELSIRKVCVKNCPQWNFCLKLPENCDLAIDS